jgi:hypothetical protein
MNEQAQRIAIATACGWVIEKVCDGSLIGKPKNEQGPMDDLPDYLNDLNAMHEAEKMLSRPQWESYLFELHKLIGHNHIEHYAVSATAAHRAEAFLRTIGKWEE